jgi:hypothetical protein
MNLWNAFTAETPEDMPRDKHACPEVEQKAELVCDVCQNESPFWIFPSCKECTAAYVIAVPGPWASNRKHYESRPECRELDREIARQKEALAHLSRACA